MKNLSGEEITILATAIAILVTQDMTIEDINYVTSIFFAIASTMNLIANQRALQKGQQGPTLI
jgi:hypothetical protein